MVDEKQLVVIVGNMMKFYKTKGRKIMSNKSITITEEQFREAVMKAQDRWESVGEKSDTKNPMTLFMMGLQNIAFGAIIAKVLFKESEGEE